MPDEKTRGPWTQFMDMHSGGRQKLPARLIYIQASEAVAVAVFKKTFGRNPNKVTCRCCGSDYSIHEEKDLYQATAFERNCTWEGKGYVEKGAKGKYAPLEEYLEVYEALTTPEKVQVIYEEPGWRAFAEALEVIEKMRQDGYDDDDD